ncbi:MAG: protein kinase [Chloroflexi bacterium]|nr:protein kinase [Chloroflexota bacterium]
MTDPLIGTRLDEYRLEGLLGQGGMARVYCGLDTGLQRYGAIKVIDTPYQQDESYMTRFEREARAIAQLDHPHIVTVYRYGRSQNLLYLAMKYIEGADLHAILSGYEQDGQFMPFDEVARLIREIGSALDYAHSQGVVHRDIKPSNVMLDDQGRSYITDFGLALLADVGTHGEILGSPNYIAPEQAVSSAGAVPQSDLYALGVILFRMVTGQLPFTHDDMLELLMLHMTALPPDPRELRPDINSALATVILKALAKEPDERYASGKALAVALETALKETAVASTAATLTIMDRVALDMEDLPPLPAVVTPQITAPQPTTPAPKTVPPTGEQLPGAQEMPLSTDVPPHPLKLPVFLKGAGAIVVLLLIVLTAFFLLRNQENTNTPMTDGIATATTELAVVETVEVENVSLPRGTSTVTVNEAANSPLDPTITPLPEALPQSSETVYLPIISNEEEPPTSIAPASTADTPSPTAYQLLIATNGKDSLFVVSQSEEAFPLDPLRLGSGNGAIQETEWGLGQLAPGDCVTAWKDGGNPQPPDVDCNQVGVRVIRQGPDRFWKDQFDVFYDGEQVGVCNPQGQCLIEITK